MYGSYSSLYAQWCKCYDNNGIEVSILKKHVDFQDKTILDIGCGTGRFIFKVLPFAKHIVGVDNDPESIKVLNSILEHEYSVYKSNVDIYCQDIEGFQTTEDSIDIAVFTWSFYALSEKKAKIVIENLHSMLNKNGVIIILQPVGGEFERVMRCFFTEHENMDEYETALSNMNNVLSPFFAFVEKDQISSEFVVKDISFMAESLRMFATTEGGCLENELNSITKEAVQKVIKEYMRKDGFYHFSDEVEMYIFKKEQI